MIRKLLALVLLCSCPISADVGGPGWIAELSRSAPPHAQATSITLPVGESATVYTSSIALPTVEAPEGVEATLLTVDSETRRVYTGTPLERIVEIPYWLPPEKWRRTEGPTPWAVRLTPTIEGKHEVTLKYTYGSFTVELDVRPAVPDPDAGFGFYFGLQQTHYPEQIDKYLADMKAHRLNTASAFISSGIFSGLTDKQPVGKKPVDLGWGTTDVEFAAWMLDKYVEYDLDAVPIMCLHMVTPEYLNEVKMLAKREWPELLGYNWDEPPATVEAGQNVAHYSKQWREAKYRTCVAMSAASAFLYGELLDVWVIYADKSTEALKAECARQNAEYWVYFNNRGTNAPFNRYYTGLWTWTVRPKVALRWAYTHFPWARVNEDGTWEASGYHEHVLPSPDGPISSVGYEGMRDGIIDYMVLRELERQLEARRQDPLVPEIAQWLQDLREAVQWDLYPDLRDGNDYGELSEKEDQSYGPWYWDAADMAEPPIADMNSVRKKACDYLDRLRDGL